jgi:hypothetical protein
MRERCQPFLVGVRLKRVDPWPPSVGAALRNRTAVRSRGDTLMVENAQQLTHTPTQVARLLGLRVPGRA